MKDNMVLMGMGFRSCESRGKMTCQEYIPQYYAFKHKRDELPKTPLKIFLRLFNHGSARKRLCTRLTPSGH